MADPMLRGIVRLVGGTGFVVSEDGLVITCAHVLRGVPVGGRVDLAFHATGKLASTHVQSLRDDEDLAILRLDARLPAEVRPLRLSSMAGVRGRTFDTFGFPDAKQTEGMGGQCAIISETTDRGFRILQARSSEITGGYSGAPVWDVQQQVVIGIAKSVAARDELGRQSESAFVIPVETLLAVCPQLQVLNTCPYRGLAAFTEEDADFFFGRERLVEMLLSHLRSHPAFLAVVGPSGSGKSSVVRAGLIPALHRSVLPDSKQWTILTIRPGTDPYTVVDVETLSSSASRTVLFIDQFEELFALSPGDVQTRFLADLDGLVKNSPRVSVVLALRGDFYGHLQQSSLGEQLPAHQVNVDRITSEDLRATIEKPADRVGLRFEVGLVDTIVQDAQRADHALPLLQSALVQLWEQQEDGLVTYAAYHHTGRVSGALGLRADATYRSLNGEEQALARRVFTRLVHYGEEARGDTRRRLHLRDLASDESERGQMHVLVSRLADARLLVTDGDGSSETVEIIHDALLREWGHLREWINTQREFRLWQQRLETQRQQWEENNYDEGGLLHGALLGEAERQRDEHCPELRVCKSISSR